MLADCAKKAISGPKDISFLPPKCCKDRDLRLLHAAVAEASRCDLIYDARQRRALLLERRHTVVHLLVAEVLNRRRQVPEEDCRASQSARTHESKQPDDKELEVLTDAALPNLLRDFDVGPVDGAVEAAVEAEPHVRRARRFRAGRGDVLGRGPGR